MPLNVRRFCALGLLIVPVFITGSSAQTTATPTPVATAAVPTSGDVMRERISKAKAYIVVRNYNAAIYELENIRRETADPAVHAVVNVLLMNSYLEQGDFKRAQEFLNEAYAAQKASKPNSSQFYNAVASQAIKGARSRAERYRDLGLSVSDRTLPLEASNDLEKMRETLEMVITQSKEIAKDPKKTADAMMLVEEASTSRSMIGRDDYDARRWRDGVADAREELANSRSSVLNAVNDVPADSANAGSSTTAIVPAAAQSPALKPVVDQQKPVQTAGTTVKTNTEPIAKNDSPQYVPAKNPPVKETPKPVQAAAKAPDVEKPQPAANEGPIEVGSLIAYATRQQPPVYPNAAKVTRTIGVVKVELTVDEKGDVAAVQNASGPTLLQQAAKDAVRKWKFRPFVRDGQPVKAVGFISFNFAL